MTASTHYTVHNNNKHWYIITIQDRVMEYNFRYIYIVTSIATYCSMGSYLILPGIYFSLIIFMIIQYNNITAN